MRIFFILIAGLKLMAEISIPYPYPNYDSDLLAKEVVNGTYMASINMMTHNTKTGEDRYVYVPDSPDVIEKMQSGNEIGDVKLQSLDENMTVYDRNKSLEDAVLPVKKQIEEDLPIIVSYAQCPQGLTYVSTIDAYFNPVGRFYDGSSAFFVGVEIIDDKGTSNLADDVMGFFKVVGTTKTKLFQYNQNDMAIEWIYSIDRRNFFYANGKLYEYSSSGTYSEVRSLTGGSLPIMLKDNDEVYVVNFYDGNIIATNIDTGGQISKETSFNTTSIYTPSAYRENTFYTITTVFVLKDGEWKIKDENTYKRWEHANIKVRFEYLNDNLVTKFNIRHGHPKYPMTKRPSSRGEKLIGLKEGYISISNGKLYFTKNYMNFINSGISVHNNSSIIITKDYIYVYFVGHLEVISVDGWSTVIPSNKYAELFAKNLMLDNQNDEPRIGDY